MPNERVPDINTSYPGFAFGFDAEKQTCSVKLAIENLFVGMVDPYSLIAKQELINVKVQFIQGAGWSLTHPIPDGTPVYVHFAQRGTSHYFVSGSDKAGWVNGKPAPQFFQKFSHNNGVAIVGLQPDTSAIKDFNLSAFELRNEDRSQRVSLVEGGNIEIVSGQTTITIGKDNAITMQTSEKISAKAPQIELDGDTTITKSLTVAGGLNAKGGSNVTGSLKINGVEVDKHVHKNPEGGNVGPMGG